MISTRKDIMQRLTRPVVYDLVVVGGGATGLGVALDAAARGFVVALVEAHDFASGTSSRATKLVHGGVRYLAQRRFALVREALRERRILLSNAPHLVHALPFVIPIYHWWQAVFYGLGLGLYGLLAGKAALGPTTWLSRSATLRSLSALKPQGLKGGVQYWDAQFDDARLALELAHTAEQWGACVANYCAATGLLHEGERVTGLTVRDEETGQAFTLRARCVVNATGVWVDALRQQDAQATGHTVQAMVAPSQGAHVVVDKTFWPSAQALLLAHTRDGRVLFVLPWLGKVILGTTDTPRADLPHEPLPLAEEIDFILQEAAPYLRCPPSRADVRSAWAGLRPLVRLPNEPGQHTRRLSREHAVLVSSSGLVTVTGGKWTTYRVMAEDVLQHCFAAGLLPTRVGPGTAQMRLHSLHNLQTQTAEAGSTAQVDPALSPGFPGLTQAAVRFAARHAYARTVEDVLARRHRLLFLDAALAQAVAPAVAEWLEQETGIDPQLQTFLALAQSYRLA